MVKVVTFLNYLILIGTCPHNADIIQWWDLEALENKWKQDKPDDVAGKKRLKGIFLLCWHYYHKSFVSD